MISAFARLLVLTLSLAAAAAQADVLLDITDQLIAANPTQLGRLSRNGVPQDWAQSTVFPGVVNSAATYHYKTYVVPVGAVTPGELKRHLRGLLPSQFVPSKLIFVRELSFTASGKIDRAATQRAATEQDTRGAGR